MSGVKYRDSVKGKLIGLAAAGVVLLASATPLDADAKKPQVITLTQTGCQFVEPEGRDRKFKTGSANDCKAINTKKRGKAPLLFQDAESQAGKVHFPGDE